MKPTIEEAVEKAEAHGRDAKESILRSKVESAAESSMHVAAVHYFAHMAARWAARALDNGYLPI